MSLNNGFEHDRGHVLHHSNIEYPKRYYYDPEVSKQSLKERASEEKKKSSWKWVLWVLLIILEIIVAGIGLGVLFILLNGF